MKETFLEILYVVAYSERTQWAMFLGVGLFVGIHMLGSHFAGDVMLTGHLRVLEETVAGKIMHRYDKLAWCALLACWWQAFRFYRRDRDRLWRS